MNAFDFTSIAPRNSASNRNVKFINIETDEIRSLVYDFERQMKNLIQAQNELIAKLNSRVDEIHKRVNVVEEKFESVIDMFREFTEVKNELQEGGNVAE